LWYIIRPRNKISCLPGTFNRSACGSSRAPRQVERGWQVRRPASTSVDWKALREDFPILRERVHGRPLIYFDNAATTQKPRPVLEILRQYYEHTNANVHRGLHELSSRATEAYERARQRVADYLGAASA